jgi:hypothetical protein
VEEEAMFDTSHINHFLGIMLSGPTLQSTIAAICNSYWSSKVKILESTVSVATVIGRL